MLTILIVVGIVSCIIINNYMYKKELDNKMRIFTESLKNDDYDTAIDICDSLTDKDLENVRADFVKCVVREVKDNKYIYVMELPPSYVSDGDAFEYIPRVLDYDVIYKYEKYKEICESLKISESDNTNVTEYVDSVLSLKEYAFYEEYCECVKKVMPACMRAIKLLSEGTDYIFYPSIAIEKFDSALDIVEECINTIDGYDNSSGIYDDYIIAFNSFEDILKTLVSGNNVSYEQLETMKNYFAKAGVGLGSMYDSVNSAVESLPDIY